jgi:type IV pilus assembly protein PilQ|tara:strand:- start:1526 stop:3082 length:1557 start_codon:yes stop_codon:yes gene_type:complete
MSFQKKISFLILPLFILFLSGCADKLAKKSKSFKHDTPLIKTDVKQLGKKELNTSASMGPVPVDGDVVKLKKRKQLSSVKERNYLLISEEFTSLKQNVSFKFQALDFKEAMRLMAEIGNINILVGDEVAGSVSAELDNVPWDKAFNALLDLKSYAADIDVASNIIRVSTPANLTSQESYKSARASAVKKKVEIEDSVEPIISEIFRLYYITPAEAKATISELFTSVGTGGNFIPIQVTEEATTRSIIVRGKEKDLDIVDKVIREIDKRTKQVLIEAFIVEASSTFEQNLGKRLGFAYTRNRERVGGTQGGSSIGNAGGSSAAIGDSTGGFTSGAGTDNLLNLGSAASTAGIGILRRTGSAVLKLELDALENEGLSKTVSNPKLFTLDNQQASINQGETIYIDGGEGEDKAVDASLKLIVTPNIIGDGNVMLQIQVNNDTPNRSNPGTPGVNKMEINTKLLVADGDIVVIGGIKKNNVANSKGGVPGVSKLPVVGKALSGTSKSDTMNELLVFIAPRIL